MSSSHYLSGLDCLSCLGYSTIGLVGTVCLGRIFYLVRVVCLVRNVFPVKTVVCLVGTACPVGIVFPVRTMYYTFCPVDTVFLVSTVYSVGTVCPAAAISLDRVVCLAGTASLCLFFYW